MGASSVALPGWLRGLLGASSFFLTPLSAVPDVNSRSARVLFLLVVPGHLVFLYTISCMQGGHTTLTLIFIIFYMTAALLQVWRQGKCPAGTKAHHHSPTGLLWTSSALVLEQVEKTEQRQVLSRCMRQVSQTLVINPTGQNTELHLTAKHAVPWEIYLNEGLNRFKECQNPLCVCMIVCCCWALNLGPHTYKACVFTELCPQLVCVAGH